MSSSVPAGPDHTHQQPTPGFAVTNRQLVAESSDDLKAMSPNTEVRTWEWTPSAPTTKSKRSRCSVPRATSTSSSVARQPVTRVPHSEMLESRSAPRRASRSPRRTHRGQSTSPQNAASSTSKISRSSGVRYSRRRTGSATVARPSETPSSRRARIALPGRLSPSRASGGPAAWSTKRTAIPRWAHARAIAKPAMPPPTTRIRASARSGMAAPSAMAVSHGPPSDRSSHD